jgi:hypothetical protein
VRRKKIILSFFFKKIHRRLWIFIVFPSRCPSSHQGGYHAALSKGYGEHKGGVQVPGLQNPEIPWEARGIVLMANKCKSQAMCIRMGGGPETPSFRHEYYVTNRPFHARKGEKFGIIIDWYGKRTIKNGKHCMIGVTLRYKLS